MRTHVSTHLRAHTHTWRERESPTNKRKWPLLLNLRISDVGSAWLSLSPSSWLGWNWSLPLKQHTMNSPNYPWMTTRSKQEKHYKYTLHNNAFIIEVGKTSWTIKIAYFTGKEFVETYSLYLEDAYEIYTRYMTSKWLGHPSIKENLFWSHNSIKKWL